MRFRLIACEVLLREFSDALARSPHTVDAEFLPKGLHDQGGAAMRDELQRRVDLVDPETYDATLIGYALCGNGLSSLTARATPLIVPRAHDCITLLMGNRERYAYEFAANPGTYYRSTGWLERGFGLQQLPSLDALIAKYGEDNGRYLWSEYHSYQHNYSRLVFIETGLEPDGSFEQQARDEAAAKGWTFARIQGSLALFNQLLSGDWPGADFLTVPPGRSIAATYDEGIIQLS